MFVGDINARSKTDAARFRQLTYTCMENAGSREQETVAFPNKPCKYGIMTSLRFPTCWDGVNLDSRKLSLCLFLAYDSLMTGEQRTTWPTCRTRNPAPSNPQAHARPRIPFAPRK